MRNLDVRPRRREPFDVPRQDASCLGVEVTEIVAAPVVEEAGALASVERALPLTVLDLVDRYAQTLRCPPDVVAHAARIIALFAIRPRLLAHWSAVPLPVR
jgi:hypothetical protein